MFWLLHPPQVCDPTWPWVGIFFTGVGLMAVLVVFMVVAVVCWVQFWDRQAKRHP